jgi:two-component system, cell cycle sensor histidine kinase and response regulator CckA
MTDQQNERTPGPESLRAHAETRARAEEALVMGTLPPQDARQLLHELRVHEIELELQNEELRRAQIELEAERTRYFDLYDLAPVSYFTLNHDGIIVEANLTAATLLGRARTSLIKRPFTSFLYGPDQDRFYLLRKRLADSGPTQATELRLVREDGVLVWVELNAASGSDMAGAAPCWLAATDVTDRKRTEEMRAQFELQIQQNQRLESLGILAGGIAHDFNNLLGGIFGYLELAKSLVEPGSEVADTLALALQPIDRARALTRQLLTFARGGEPMRRAVAPAALVTENARFALSGSSVGCTFELPADLSPVDVDAGQIGQVVDNLVRNAVEATAPGGTLAVSAVNVQYRAGEHPQLCPGNYVRLTVRDTGCGIAKDVLARIFDPFFTTKTRGSGMGLSVAHSIVKRHRGCIEVASEEGRGSAFHVFLPAHVATSSGAYGSGLGEMPHFGARIIIMDDEPAIRAVLARYLTKWGYRVTAVPEGGAAVEAVREALLAGDPFHFAFIDLTVVGGLGGKATMDHLKPLVPDLVAFVMSGYCDDPIMAQPRDHGFAASLTKPFTKDDLEAVLRGRSQGE